MMSFAEEKEKVEGFIRSKWLDECVPCLQDYIAIPNLSPFFDEEVLTNGLQDKAMELIVQWVKKQEVEGLTLEVVREEGRTPLLLLEIEGQGTEGTVLLYGHMDKQPPFEGWKEGLGPYTPVLRDGKLYGRGGADDGYSVFSAVTAIKSLQLHKIAHSRCVVMIEASEESGSRDLPFYVEKLKQRIGQVDLVVCLDSGCGNYDQLWVTTSLRGTVCGHLKVEILTEGIHSGSGSGVAADSFRIARSLVSRIENETTGEVMGDVLHCAIPEKAKEQAFKAADVLGESTIDNVPLVAGAETVSKDVRTLALNRWWRPQLTVIGASGLPPSEKAGNVLRPSTTLTLSLRLPPLVDAKVATEFLKKELTRDPPYGANVSFEVGKAGSGWAAPKLEPWLEQATENASETFYKKPAVYQSEGGSIPFMGMLGKKFPQAQFLIVGVLGPQSNAHGPNEFLHIEFSLKLTCCIASILSSHYQYKSSQQQPNKKPKLSA